MIKIPEKKANTQAASLKSQATSYKLGIKYGVFW